MEIVNASEFHNRPGIYSKHLEDSNVMLIANERFLGKSFMALSLDEFRQVYNGTERIDELDSTLAAIKQKVSKRYSDASKGIKTND